MDVSKLFTSDAYKAHASDDEYTRTAWAILAAESINAGDYQCNNEGKCWRFHGLIEGRYSFSHAKHPATGHVMYFKVLPSTIERLRNDFRQILRKQQEAA